MTLTQETNGLHKKRVEEDIGRLRDWLDKQPHLPHNIDDDFLRGFVCGTKTLEIAKQKLDAWFTTRGKAPQLFSRSARDPRDSDFKAKNKAVKMFFLPKPTPEGFRVQFLSQGSDPDVFYHPQKIARCTMQIELALKLWPDCKGLICVYDLDKIPNSIYTKLSPTATAAGLQWFQSAMPMKLKKVVVFNAIPIIDMILNTIIRPFLKEKLFNRICVSSEGEKFLKKFVPTDMLPEDYGGNEKHSDELNAEWEKLLEEHADYFLEQADKFSDEKKRPADKESTYGVEGTFRTLTLD